MKIRNGFVSNSSSSSFTCDVCEENYSGMDAGLEEAEMSECVKGHVICDSHLLEDAEDYHDMTFEQKKEHCLRLADYESTKKSINEAEHEDALDDIYDDELRYEARYNVPTSTCPCCGLVSPTTGQVLEYLLWDKGIARNDAEDEMRTRFTDYDEMEKKIEGK